MVRYDHPLAMAEVATLNTALHTEYLNAVIDSFNRVLSHECLYFYDSYLKIHHDLVEGLSRPASEHMENALWGHSMLLDLIHQESRVSMTSPGEHPGSITSETNLVDNVDQLSIFEGSIQSVYDARSYLYED